MSFLDRLRGRHGRRADFKVSGVCKDSVEYLTPYMVVLFPLMWAGRRAAAIVARARRRSPIDAHDLARRELRVVPGANALVEALLALERPAIRRRRRLPIGGSLLAVARAT